jgi:transposase
MKERADTVRGGRGGMPRRIVIAPHLTVAELEQRYRRVPDPVASRHWQIVWLLAQGQTGQQVAASTGYSTRWIGQLAQRYNAAGPAGLGDHRHQNPGSARVLSAAHEADLVAALAGPAPDGGMWTGPKVAAWIGTATGRAVSAHLGWVSLRRLGFTPRRPRPRHAQADAAAQAAFPKPSRPPSHRSKTRSPRRGSRAGRWTSTASA